MTEGSIIIAAHNEATVIGRTLAALSGILTEGTISVFVVCNGCTDATAEIASAHDGVTVVELAEASKPAALRAGDSLAGGGPRIYLDADVVLTSRAAGDVVRALDVDAIAGRPPHVFDSSRAGWAVRSWYRIRQQLPTISSALWGAGCYGLSEAGRARFTEFPDIVSDDLFIDSLFDPAEVTIVDTDPLVVTTPRRVGDLVRILQRSYRTQREVAEPGAGLSAGQRGQLRDILGIVRRSPSRAADAVVYVAVVAFARIRARLARRGTRWERDSSSREPS